MRVAQIIETMAMGGAENLAVHIAAALADRGHESHLIVIEDPGVLSEKVPPQVHLHHLGYHRASISEPLRFAASARQGYKMLSGLIRAEEIEVVQTHLPGSNFWGLALALRKTCKVVATVHNNEEFNYGRSDSRLRLHVRKLAYRQIIRRTCGVVAVSASVRDSLVRDLDLDAHDAGRISVVTNAVPIPEPLPAGRRDEIRARFGVATDQAFVLAAGRFSPQKNFKDLTAAAKFLASRTGDFHLVIAGDGEERSELCEWVDAEDLSATVSMPGNLVDLGDVMQAADIFVMSSLWEGLPLVLIEAMAAGLPVVAYDIDGINEVLVPEQTGVSVDKGDPAGLGKAMERLISNPQERRAMGLAGRDVIASHFSFEALVDQLLELYGGAERQ